MINILLILNIFLLSAFIIFMLISLNNILERFNKVEKENKIFLNNIIKKLNKNV